MSITVLHKLTGVKCFCVTLSTLFMDDQESKDESEHTPGDETAKQGTAELLRLQAEIQRHRQKPGLLAFFSAYVLLVGTVIGGGALASYAGHGTATQVIFYVSIALLVVIPVVLVCYLALSIHRRYPFLKKIASFFERHVYAIMYVFTAMAVGVIARCVWRFPLHPRANLTFILLNSASIVFWFVMGHVLRIHELLIAMDKITGRIIRILEKQSGSQPPPPPN
jgi:hypothetical protein